MAKINFGGIVQDARGKQNGLVYSKNKSGAYVRKKVTPINPQTIFQQTVRNNFGNTSKGWSGTLTDSERAQWIAYAQSYPIRDVFGASINLNGMNMFIRLNQVLKQDGGTAITTPPDTNLVTPIPIDASSFSAAFASATSMTFQQTAAAPETGTVFYLWATPSMSAGRTSVKSDYRMIGVLPALTGTFPAGVDMSALYVARFGEVITGKRVSVLVATASTVTGIVSIGVPMSAIVS